MHSPIDDASEQAQNSLDRLFNEALEFAAEQVPKTGGFLPFAMAEDVHGQISMEMVGDDIAEDEMLDVLWRGFRDKADDLVAVVVAEDVYIPSLDSDAIQIYSEHSERIAVESTSPYRRKRLRRSLTFGEFLLAPGVPRIW
jgi:hypothetical protein